MTNEEFPIALHRIVALFINNGKLQLALYLNLRVKLVLLQIFNCSGFSIWEAFLGTKHKRLFVAKRRC